MSASFEIVINKILTTNIGEMTDVIKKVEFTVKGTQEGCSFELPQIVDLTEPESASFKPLPEVTQEDVTAWIVANFDSMSAVQSHIQFILDKEVAKAQLENKPLPWAPAPEPQPEVVSPVAPE